MNNFYSELEIQENSSSDEIKKAYRKLSLKYHPDRNPNNKESEDRFKKISEAYETLSDVDKRQQYDSMRKSPFGNMGNMHNMGNMGQSFHNIDVNDLFSNLFSNMAHQSQTSNGDGFAMPTMFGMGGMGGMGGPNIRIFRNGQQINPTQHTQQHVAKPEPIIKTLHITLEECYNGATKQVDVERWVMDDTGNKVIENINIPVPICQGIDNQSKIILKNMGNNINNIIKGDIEFTIFVGQDDMFTRDNLNLSINVNVPLIDALCGFLFEFKHINGKKYAINNMQNVLRPNQVKEINGLGLTRGKNVGSLIIKFNIVFPDKIDEEHIPPLKELFSKFSKV